MGRASLEAKLAALSLVFLCLFYVPFRFVCLRELRETIRKNDIREGADGDTEVACCLPSPPAVFQIRFAVANEIDQEAGVWSGGVRS